MSIQSKMVGVLCLMMLSTSFASVSAQVAKQDVAAQQHSCSGSDPLIVCTRLGPLRGVQEGHMHAFLGVPYAQAPVGALRWRPPAPLSAWEGVRAAQRFGPSCPQLNDNRVVGDEDCLYLNLWRPAEKSEKPLPVMVYFHGGGNHSLSGEGTSDNFGGLRYDGALLTTGGTIFVSFNHRLGALGFLAHSALDAERSEHVSGNYGSLDQIAVLRWLKEHVADFGGDPSRIMVFGASAGGANICGLLTSPLAQGLIHSASIQSAVPTGCAMPTLAFAEQGVGQRVAQSLGCTDAATTASCLRSKSVQEIVKAVPGTFSLLPRLYGPVEDGWLFPDQPLSQIRKGKVANIPMIIGNTSDETLGWVDTVGKVSDASSYAAAIERLFGLQQLAVIQARYPLTNDADARNRFAQLTNDAFFTCQSLRIAQLLSARGQPVYRYLFTRAQENDPVLKSKRARHTMEGAFIFSPSGTYQYTSEELALRKATSAYWSGFARTGIPVASAPQWPKATATGDAYLELGVPIRADQGTDQVCSFWESIDLSRPHL